MKKIVCSVIIAIITAFSFSVSPVCTFASSAQTEEVLLPAPDGFKASSTATTVTISWSRVEGAAAYKIYIYDTVLKKYTVCKSVKKTTAKIIDLEKDTEYKFKVRTLTEADGKYVNQRRSGVIRITTKLVDAPTAQSDNYTGWGSGSSSSFYFEKGVVCSGFKKIDSSYYYFTTEGFLKGWLNNKGLYYYFDGTGKMVKSKTLKINGEKYEFGADGVVDWYSNTVEPTAKYTVPYEELSIDVRTSSKTDSDSGAVGMYVTNNGSKKITVCSLGQLIDNTYDSFDRLLALYDNGDYADYITIKSGKESGVFYVVAGDNTWYDKKTTIIWYAIYDGVGYEVHSGNYYGTWFKVLHFDLAATLND